MIHIQTHTQENKEIGDSACTAAKDIANSKDKYHSNGNSIIKKDLNLNLLITLELLLRECSVGRTAKHLGISQAAVSAQLTKLRQHFRDDLLVVRNRSLIRTPFAEKLVGPLYQLLNDARNLASLRQDFDPSRTERVFNILAGDISTFSLLSHLNRILERVAPGITLNIKGLGAHPKEVDFTILPQGILDHALSVQALYEDDYCILADINHPEIGDTINEADYLNLKHVVRYFGDSGTPSVEAATMLRLGYQRKIGAVVDAYGSIPFFLMDTRYISTVPISFAKSMVERFPLKCLPLPFEFPKVTVYLYWNKDASRDTASQWMKDQIINISNTLYAHEENR